MVEIPQLEALARTIARRPILLLLLLAVVPRLGLTAPGSQPITEVDERDIKVTRVGQGFAVDMDVFFPVRPAVVWAVLTDYEHMSVFVPNLSSSTVTGRGEGPLSVTQKGVARFGPWSFAFESVREIRLTPPSEIRSHGIGGNLERVESTTRLSAEASGTRMLYHTDVVPGVWFPPLVGPAVVRAQTARQFSAMLAEMRRRDTGA